MSHQKLPSKIKQLSKQDVFAAEMLATRGKIYSPIEEILWLYYGGLARLKKNHIDAFERKALEHYQPIHEEQLCGLFLNALSTYDHRAINEIAKAVSYFQKLTTNPQPTVDRVRAALLCYKSIFERHGKKFVSYEHAATVCEYLGNMDVFKRMANALKVPIVKRTGGRPRKPRQLRRRPR